MTPATLRLVLLISCAHALVHIYEHALPSVEMLIGQDYSVGERVTGSLGTIWRLPFGFAAFLAGWLADRVGAKPMLLVYLVGCSATSALAFLAPSLAALFAVMFAMGLFASIYHPTGLALISHETPVQFRPLALGYHGILGSLGIAAAPFLAAVVLNLGVGWRQYYLVLVLPGALLAVVLAARLRQPPRQHATAPTSALGASHGDWAAYAALCVAGTLAGFIYAALLHFLPRYLGESGVGVAWIPPASLRNYLAAGVLLVGCVGQYVAGRWAVPDRLEPLMMLILAANAPFLAWMGVAEGWQRVAAAALFALVHFMHQPIYNSLIAHYVPGPRRSLGYGVSNTLTFGVGALGATFAGYARAEWGETVNYSLLAMLALLAAGVAAGLWWRVAHNRLSDTALQIAADDQIRVEAGPRGG